MCKGGKSMSSDAIGNDSHQTHAGTTRTFQLFLPLKHDTSRMDMLAFHSPLCFFVQDYCFKISIVQGALTSLGIPIWWCDLKATRIRKGISLWQILAKGIHMVIIWPVWNVTIRITSWSQKSASIGHRLWIKSMASSSGFQKTSLKLRIKGLQSSSIPNKHTQSHNIWRYTSPIFAPKHELQGHGNPEPTAQWDFMSPLGRALLKIRRPLYVDISNNKRTIHNTSSFASHLPKDHTTISLLTLNRSSLHFVLGL